MLVFDINWDCVESLYAARSTLPPRLLFKMMERRIAAAQGWKSGDTSAILSDDPGKGYTYHWAFPAGWFVSFGWLTMPWIARKATRIAKKLLGAMPDTVSFVSPHYIHLQKALKPNITVYHPIDDYATYWPRRAALTKKHESEMMDRSDLIICAGHYLCQELKQLYPKSAALIHHIPNPVPDDCLVSSPLAPTGNSRPVLGYIGSLADRVELGAIRALSQAMPECDILLRADRLKDDPFAGCTNVQYHPRVSVDGIPKLIQTFDVCLVPQKDSHFNRCSSPRKLYEYLGSSRPIVALNTPEADSLSRFVYSTSTTADFVDTVQHIVQCGEDEKYPAARLELARARLPSKLADQYAVLLNETRKRKNLQ